MSGRSGLFVSIERLFKKRTAPRGLAHSSGKMDRDSVETELFKELSHSLALEERIEVSWNRFSSGYEASFGYPIESSPLSNAIREEKE